MDDDARSGLHRLLSYDVQLERAYGPGLARAFEQQWAAFPREVSANE